MTSPIKNLTVKQAVDLYENSQEFGRLSKNSKRAYRVYMKRLAPVNERILTSLRRQELINLWHGVGPAAQANTVRLAARIMEWASEEGLVDDATALPIIRIPRPKAIPLEAWTDPEIASIRKAAKEYNESTGVSFVADAIELAMSTGQRMGDVTSFVTSNWDGQLFTVHQQKTGAIIRFQPNDTFQELAHTAKRQGENFILIMPPPNHGREARLRYHFGVVRAIAGVDKTFHGLRKTVAVKLREAGASNAQIAALLGHRTTRMVEHYAQEANQVALASSAANLLTGLGKPQS